MAKEKNSAAKAVETPVNDNLDTTFENLKKGNLVSQGVNEKALEAIAKSKEEEQIRMAQRAIKEAEYNNLKTVLRLRDQRRRARIAKEAATATKELLEGLVGKKGDDGKFIPGTLTPTEYEKKRNELKENISKKIKEASTAFSEETDELHTKFPDYWAYDNCWDNMIFRSINRY